MFLFILESIGTPELILIAIVALIVFGPRKLPQMVKTVGKTMAGFRNATNEFKTTWEREASLLENGLDEKINSPVENPKAAENTIAKDSPQTLNESQLPLPEIKEVSAEDFSKNLAEKKNVIEEIHSEESKAEKTAPDKRDWL